MCGPENLWSQESPVLSLAVVASHPAFDLLSTDALRTIVKEEGVRGLYKVLCDPTCVCSMHTYMLLRLPQCQRIAVLIRHSCRMLLTPSFSDNLLFLSARLSASSSLFLSRRRCFQGLVPGLIGTTHGGFQFVAYEDLKKRFNRRANRHPEAQLVCAQHVLCACACVCVCLQELAACLLVSSLSSSSSFSASSLFIRRLPRSSCFCPSFCVRSFRHHLFPSDNTGVHCLRNNLQSVCRHNHLSLSSQSTRPSPSVPFFLLFFRFLAQ